MKRWLIPPIGLGLALALASGCTSSAPTPTPTSTPTPQDVGSVELSVNPNALRVGETVTVIGVPVGRPREDYPIYKLYFDSGLFAEATYDGQVNWFESHEGLPFELASTSATMSRIEFVLSARHPVSVEVSISASVGIPPGSPVPATLGERFSESVTITVTSG